MGSILQAFGYLKQYPELVAMLLASVGSWSAAALLEVFLPLSMSQRAQKQLTVAVNVVAGTVLSSVIWLALDPSDRRSLNYAVSAVVGVASPWSYVYVSRTLAHFFPWATAWIAAPPVVPPAPPAPAPPSGAPK